MLAAARRHPDVVYFRPAEGLPSKATSKAWRAGFQRIDQRHCGAGRVEARDRNVDPRECGLLGGEVLAGLDRPADAGVHALDRMGSARDLAGLDVDASGAPQVWVIVCGHTAPTVSGRPLSPSRTIISTSFTPRFLHGLAGVDTAARFGGIDLGHRPPRREVRDAWSVLTL
jgi:hypothetical protein